MTISLEEFSRRVAEIAALPLAERQAALDELYDALQRHLDPPSA